MKKMISRQVWGIKVRGVFDTVKQQMLTLRNSSTDSSFHVFIGQVDIGYLGIPSADGDMLLTKFQVMEST